MLVGVCRIELFIPSAQSLKEKRGIVKSLKTRIAQKFNVSIAEVEYQDKWQRAVLGVALVGTEEPVMQQTLSFIENFVSQEFRVQIIGWQARIS